MRDKEGNVYALTYRVGRHMPGVGRIFMDLLAQTCAAHRWVMGLVVVGWLPPALGWGRHVPHSRS